MLIAVGSVNRSKLDGVRKAFEMYYSNVEVVGNDVGSDLPPQPIGLNEVFKGALVRALRAIKLRSDAAYGVGVEAGLLCIEGRWFDVHVASIVGSDGWITYGLSPAFEVPMQFIDKILTGEAKELEVVVDDYFRTKDIGEHGGFVKILSKGRVLRDELVFYATLMALIPRVNRELYLSVSPK